MLLTFNTKLPIGKDVLPEKLHLVPVFDDTVTDRIFEMAQAAPCFQIASNPPIDQIRRKTCTIRNREYRHSR